MVKSSKLVILISLIVLFSCKTHNKNSDLLLWYDEPAEDWNQALPLGNGRLGAMIFGDPAIEHLQLNEETIWAGGPYNNIHPEVGPYLEQVRDLIFQGKYAESHALANEKIKADNSNIYSGSSDYHYSVLIVVKKSICIFTTK